jgi:membrane protein implicated in regulation of membrane protease activity
MTGYVSIIILTVVLFTLLAAILLVPVYRFLKREEEASKNWTRESLERRQQQREAGGDGSGPRPPRGRATQSDGGGETEM